MHTNTELTPEERQGRKILLVTIAIALFVSAATIVGYVMVKGTERLPIQAGRFLLTVGLMWWLYRGRPIAKWIVIVCFGLAGVFGLSTLLLGHRAAAAIGTRLGVLYLTLVSTLLTSSSVKAFLEYQRNRGSQ